jgi:hypothetical protein
VILRGNVDDQATGHDKELAIEKACEQDNWSRAVIDCVAGTPHPQDCIDTLDERQVDSFQHRIEDWRDVRDVPPPMASCTDVAAKAGQFRPALAPVDEWQLHARTQLVAELCEHGWSETLKDCLIFTQRVDELPDCIDDGLEPAERDDLAQQLRTIETLANKIDAIKKKPASFTCAKLVAQHYGDAKWKHTLDGFKPAERKRMIDESRELMRKACAAWDDTTRACVIAGGERERCFDEDNRARWGYPAIGTVKSVGIKECDDYSAAVLRFTACAKLDDAARNTIVRSQQQLLAEIARLPPVERSKMGTSCTAGLDAIASAFSDTGC